MYKLTVITPEKIVFEAEVFSLIANGGLGYLEVLSNHCSLLSTLQPGRLVITTANREKLLFAVSGGFLEVSHNIATILADAMESPKEINIERAEASAERAKKRLENPDNHIDIPRAKASLLRAENRINIFFQINHPKKLHRGAENFKV